MSINFIFMLVRVKLFPKQKWLNCEGCVTIS